MNFESVRSIIDTYIKKNGVEAITGDILNNVLNTMLDDVDTAISSIEPSPGGGGGGTADLSSYYTKAESDNRYLASSLLGSNTLIHSGNIGSQSVASAKSLVASDGTTYVSYNTTYGQVNVKGINIGYGGNTIETASGGVLNIQANSTGGTIISPYGGNVLIGNTHDNGGKLQVHGAINVTAANGAINFTNGLVTGNASFTLDVVGASYARLQTSHYGVAYTCPLSLNPNGGNVLIGTTKDASKLTVAAKYRSTLPSLGSLSANSDMAIHYDGDSAGYGMYFSVNGYTGASTIQVGRNDGNTNAYSLLLNPLGGNVGIGTTSPSYKLDVYGDSRINGNLVVSGDIASA